MRLEALQLAATLNLNDWCIAAGFVRNLVWDKLHGYPASTPLNDIDLIYFDVSQATQKAEHLNENKLKSKSTLPWSVKNQARMHLRNDDEPYDSTAHAMSFWVELETAVGAKISRYGEIELVAPFGVEVLFGNTVTINSNRLKPKEFERRIQTKRWLELWPNLRVVND